MPLLEDIYCNVRQLLRITTILVFQEDLCLLKVLYNRENTDVWYKIETNASLNTSMLYTVQIKKDREIYISRLLVEIKKCYMRVSKKKWGNACYVPRISINLCDQELESPFYNL